MSPKFGDLQDAGRSSVSAASCSTALSECLSHPLTGRERALRPDSFHEKGLARRRRCPDAAATRRMLEITLILDGHSRAPHSKTNIISISGMT